MVEEHFTLLETYENVQIAQLYVHLSPLIYVNIQASFKKLILFCGLS